MCTTVTQYPYPTHLLDRCQDGDLKLYMSKSFSYITFSSVKVLQWRPQAFMFSKMMDAFSKFTCQTHFRNITFSSVKLFNGGPGHISLQK